MRRKWIVAGAASLAAVAGAAMMATTVFGGGAEPRGVAEIDMEQPAAPANQRAKTKKPTVVYLDGAPTVVDSTALGPIYRRARRTLSAEHAGDRGWNQGH